MLHRRPLANKVLNLRLVHSRILQGPGHNNLFVHLGISLRLYVSSHCLSCQTFLIQNKKLKSSDSSCRHAYLSPGPSRHNVFVVLGVSLDFNVLLAAGGGHGEAPDLGAVVVSNSLLLSIKSHSLSNEVPAAITPAIARPLMRRCSQEQEVTTVGACQELAS